MNNWISLLPILQGVTAMPSTPTTNYLHVPTNMHIFHTYYSYHYSYRYSEQYSFKDKVLVFDGKSNEPSKYLNSILLKDLRYVSSRTFSDDADYYYYSHNDNSFVDWSNNNHGKSLKDIVQMKMYDYELFTPFNKHLVLDYSYQHSNVIPIYAFYFDGSDRRDLLSSSGITFGRHKASGIDMPRGISFNFQGPSCNELKNRYHRNNYNIPSEEGYDGVCENIKIDGKNRNFTNPAVYEHKWSTPYVAYKDITKDGWNRQIFYYILGDLHPSKGTSGNLISSAYPQQESWIIDYDDIFSLDFQENKWKITLNTENEKIKKLNLSNTHDNSALGHFIRISSYLNFEISFNHKDNQIKKKFTFEDILKDEVSFEFNNEEKLSSDITLTVSPKDSNSMGFASSPINDPSYQYRVNISKLLEGGKVFDDVEVDIKGTKEMLASELLDYSKLSQYFFWVSGTKKIPMTPNSLESLGLIGEVDDTTGTIDLKFKINCQEKKIHASGFQTLPHFSNEPTRATTIEEALVSLKAKHPQLPNHFWKQLSFREKYGEHYSNSEVVLQAYAKPYMKTQNIKMKQEWDLSDIEVITPNNKDFFLIQQQEVVDSYDNLSDLFELNTYSSAIGLDKTDYHYRVIHEDKEVFEVLVYLARGKNKLPRNADKKDNYYKTYTFTKSHEWKETVTPQNFLGNLLNSENIVMAGAGTVFLGATLVSLLKKFGLWKSRGVKL